MSAKYTTTRPGGFKITLGEKQYVFPMGEVVTVPDSVVKDLDGFAKFVWPHVEPKKKATRSAKKKSKAAAGGDGKQEEKPPEKPPQAPVSELESLGISPEEAKKLEAAGLKTRAEIAAAIDDQIDLTKFGVESATVDTIIAALSG